MKKVGHLKQALLSRESNNNNGDKTPDERSTDEGGDMSIERKGPLLASEGGIASAVTLDASESPSMPRQEAEEAEEASAPPMSSSSSRRSLQETLKLGASSLKGTLRKKKDKTTSLMQTVNIL